MSEGERLQRELDRLARALGRGDLLWDEYMEKACAVQRSIRFWRARQRGKEGGQ